MKKSILLLLISFGLAASLYAHGGGTDSNNCHTNHTTGVYHCH